VNSMSILRKMILSISVNDAVFVLASAALGYGLWCIHEAMAYIVMGSLFLLLATWGRLK
jgi:hypothetical protein